MSWAAANVPRRQGDDNNDSPSKSKDRSGRKRGETVEAVLSRLSKAYTLAMECLGAMHEANAAILKRNEQQIDSESLNSLKKVALAARHALEQAILLDPLIVQHSPTLRETIQQFAARGGDSNQHWVLLCQRRPEPPKISSKSHKSTIRQLAYLALTNYADLLMSVCSCHCARSSHTHNNDEKLLLDRGVVKKLKGFSDNFSTMGCCWNDDSEEDVQRLALVSLCDASSLDGSDPVVWLKLACAARAMGHIKALPGRLDNPVLSPFRRLERHALENGYTALPPHVPPNRAITRLLEEFNKDEFPDTYPPVLSTAPATHKINLDLTRYSWSLLGRLLMKAFREGTAANSGLGSVEMPGKRKRSVAFGSLTISLTISPMLLLPQYVLMRIVSYLEKDSIWKFEATCRALSVSIMSVRATLEKQGIQNNKIESKMKEESMDIAMEEDDNVHHDNELDEDEGNPKNEGGPDANNTSKEGPTRVSRSSKRVRSQQITSDKREERLRKRKSVGFCLRAATLASTTKSTPKDPIEWDRAQGKLWQLPASIENNAIPGDKGRLLSAEGSRQRFEASERIGSSSLSSFLDRLVSQKADPADLLQTYLSHVALHVDDVFSVDPGDTMVLSTSIMGCFELVMKRKFRNAVLPHFFDPERDLATHSAQQALTLFATDVLNVELCFKRCGRIQDFNVCFDDDSNLVSCMIPILLDATAHLQKTFLKTEREREWLKLKARVHWLAAGVFLWRSRFTRSVCESIEAEEKGLKHIGKTIECLAQPIHNPIGTVSTPHLESPGRTGAHWKKLSSDVLLTYRDEIQASSVVSHAEQQFQERVAAIVKRREETGNLHLVDDDIKAFSGIGEALLARYETPFGVAGCKHAELLDNFMSSYDILSGPRDGVYGEKSREEDLSHLDKSIPTGEVDIKHFADLTNPSILTILISCLQVKPKNRAIVVQLLVRLVLTALDKHEQMCRASAVQKQSEAESPGGFSDSEDDDSSTNGATSNKEERSDKIGACSNMLKCGRLVHALLDKVGEAISFLPADEKLQVAASDEFLELMHHALAFCSSWISYFTKHPTVLEQVLDLKVFVSIRSVAGHFFEMEHTSNLAQNFLWGLVRITCTQQLSFDSLVRVQGTIRARRSVRQRICVLRAEFLGTVLCELGALLSKNLFKVESGKMQRSEILVSTFSKVSLDSANKACSPAVLSMLCEALLWFCKYTRISSTPSEENAMSSFDRPIVDRLLVPLATAVVSLCGSASCTRLADRIPLAMETSHDSVGGDEETDPLCLTEFLDSDASVIELYEMQETKNEADQRARRELLRVLCHIVHCVGIVFGRVDEKEVISFDTSAGYKTKHGPLLPLVVARVLNHVADTLLGEFEDDESESNAQGVWSRNYPFGTNGIGALLDSALYKAYKCLHGFTLVGANDQYSTKDQISSTNVDIEVKACAPESHDAAVQLYRCVVRAGKKAPKAALETVSSALPPLQESEKSKMIKRFLFSTETQCFEVNDIVSVVAKASNWEKKFEMVKEWEQADASSDETAAEGAQNKAFEREVMRVRKGIFFQLAQGDLPMFSNESGGKEDDRTGATRFEDELYKKFSAILNTLCFRDTYSVRGWFQAAQCLILKSEVVSDRLGLSRGYCRSEHFYIPQERPPTASRFLLSKLMERQEQESVIADMGWIQYLGDDLSLYIEHQWSSFTSLQILSEKLLQPSTLQNGDDADYFFPRVRAEISKLQKKGRFAEWQQAWGGMFVTALKKVAVRCMCMAVFIFYQRTSDMKPEDKCLMPEILESLGTVLYSGMLGSQNYGYPMNVMATYRKRQLANASRICFQRSVEIARSDLNDKEDNEFETWDLVFMIGKCHEKIAFCFTQERFSNGNSESGNENSRQFERQMRQALDSYRAALDEKSDKEHGEAGGSSHGSTEVFYRLHASRLKCLLLAARAGEEERSLAEEEALRLTEEHWFSPPNDSKDADERSIRDRIWNVLSDIISALAQCRLEHSFFHRSVYRHAQALMWAPVLCDPISGRVEGSRSTVPATRSYHLRGLNHATNAANSALAVMSTLFEKKRAQLCAVWVTTSYPPTTFETLNNTVRKYDSLRGKYISAYIDCLRLCGCRNELETLLRWISSSKRDLPSFFHATAMAGGGRPEKSHVHDSLLTKNRALSSRYILTELKRRANSAMASVLKQELSSKDSNIRSLENQLKLAYACFLRLNCTLKDLKKTREWKYEPEGVREAEALSLAFLRLNEPPAVEVDPNDWSGGGQKAMILGAALQKCRELFPSLSGTYYSKKTNQKWKNQEDKEEDEREIARQTGTKRSFEVEVPQGLSEGDEFTTTIKSGEKSKKVKLTVPAGKPRMLRFSLDLSTQTYE